VSLGAYLRTWGFRTHSGVGDVAPMRMRGVLARRRYVTSGGEQLLMREKVEIVKRDGGGQRLVLGPGVQLAERVRLVFEGPDGVIEIGEDSFLNARCEIRAREHVRIGDHAGDADRRPCVDRRPLADPEGSHDRRWSRRGGRVNRHSRRTRAHAGRGEPGPAHPCRRRLALTPI
jgi:hypothetical protein